MDPGLDPVGISLRVGLEIHQQLASDSKLFCACPIAKSDELPYYFSRRLRPSQSEMGQVDQAALFEFSRGRENVYRWSPESSCLVDADEEPPHPLNGSALETSLVVAGLLGSNIVDEVHVMRKIVIDGSNTSGFQRTAVIGLGGSLAAGRFRVGVQSISLEEDAARILPEPGPERHFALDRLGVPLVEIALDPVTGNPQEIADVALHLGRALRSTGRVARGLGTIRQDLNVSVKGGRVVEVKGVQKLALLPKVVAFEASRQMGLIAIAERLEEKGVSAVRTRTADVSKELSGTSSRIIRGLLEGGGTVSCVAADGFAGLLGWEPYPGVRLGRELAEIARANSLGGVIHSDEFPRQGISPEEEAVLRTSLKVGSSAGLVLVAGEKESVERTASLISSRLEAAVGGVPAETRAATDDGETRFMRPRPGAQRMYPETDIPEVVITERIVREARSAVPVPWPDAVKALESRYGLNEELALRVYDQGYSSLFEELAGRLHLEPPTIASTLVDLPVRLTREGIPDDSLGEGRLVSLLEAVAEGRVAKEAAPDILRLLGRGEAKTVDEAIGKLGLHPMSDGELLSLVDAVIKEQDSIIRERGESAFSPLMGEVMKRARGRADGRRVSELLKAALSRRLTGTG